MSLTDHITAAALGVAAEALLKEVVDLLDGGLTVAETEILTAFAKKLRTTAPADRKELLRRTALEIGYERLAEVSMDAALKAAKKL